MLTILWLIWPCRVNISGDAVMAEVINKKGQMIRIDGLHMPVMKKDEEKVKRLCGEVPEGPLERINIYDDTVLHMATQSKQ